MRHGVGLEAWEEITSTVDVKAWINLTAADDVLAIMCIDRYRLDVCVRFTEAHHRTVRQRLFEKLCQIFQDEKLPDLPAAICEAPRQDGQGKVADRGHRAQAEGQGPAKTQGQG